MIPYKSGLDQLPRLLRLALILKSDGKQDSINAGKQPQRQTKEQTLNRASGGGKFEKSLEKSSRQINWKMAEG